jgi:arsenate reductase
MTDSKPKILFVCNHNAGRSALGAALARHRGGDMINVETAGMGPADDPSVVTIASLAEVGSTTRLTGRAGSPILVYVTLRSSSP